MIEQAAKDFVKQSYHEGKNPSFYAAEKALKRGLIWQVMEECQYNQAESAIALGINRSSLKTYIKQVFTKSEMANMGIES